MSVTPWGGLELSGITIPQTSSRLVRKHFLEAKTFRLRVRFLSLFSQRLVIKEVRSSIRELFGHRTQKENGVYQSAEKAAVNSCHGKADSGDPHRSRAGTEIVEHTI